MVWRSLFLLWGPNFLNCMELRTTISYLSFFLYGPFHFILKNSCVEIFLKEILIPQEIIAADVPLSYSCSEVKCMTLELKLQAKSQTSRLVSLSTILNWLNLLEAFFSAFHAVHVLVDVRSAESQTPKKGNNLFDCWLSFRSKRTQVDADIAYPNLKQIRVNTWRQAAKRYIQKTSFENQLRVMFQLPVF